MSSHSLECVLVVDGESLRCTECGTRYPMIQGRFHAQCRKGIDIPVAPMEVPQSSGPGTELKALLKTIGIVATPNCACNARARVMDDNGCDWCEANIDQIVGWLREEAEKRKLPFVDLGGKLLVRRAIRNARRKANSQ